MLLIIVCLLGAGALATSPQYNPPTYTPAYQTGYNATEDLLKQVVVELRLLRQDVQTLRVAGNVPQAGLTLQGVITIKCAACHRDGVAQDKGDGFVLLEKDGSLADFSLGDKRRIVRMVDKGLMPKPPATLSPEEKAVFQTLLPKEK